MHGGAPILVKYFPCSGQKYVDGGSNVGRKVPDVCLELSAGAQVNCPFCLVCGVQILHVGDRGVDRIVCHRRSSVGPEAVVTLVESWA